MKAVGFQIRCPDGKLRHFPYANRDDAEADARLHEERGCARRVKGPVRGKPFRQITDCPQGVHTVEPCNYPTSPGEA